MLSLGLPELALIALIAFVGLAAPAAGFVTTVVVCRRLSHIDQALDRHE